MTCLSPTPLKKDESWTMVARTFTKRRRHYASTTKQTKAWNEHMYNTVDIERYHYYVLLDEEWIEGAMRSTWRMT